MKLELIDQKSTNRYELEVDNKKVYIEYILSNEKIFLTHTEVPQSLEGKGYGSEIVKLVFDKIKEENLTLIPLCPFVAGYIKRHPEWKSLVFKGINID